MNDCCMYFPGKPSWLWCFLLFKCKWEVFDNCPFHKQKAAIIKYWTEECRFSSAAIVFIGWQEGVAESTCPHLTCVISPGGLWRCASKGASSHPASAMSSSLWPSFLFGTLAKKDAFWDATEAGCVALCPAWNIIWPWANDFSASQIPHL